MLAKDWMSKNVITVDIHDSMHDVMQIFRENGIRRAPVMKKGDLVGIITDRDLRRTTAAQDPRLEVHELIAVIEKVSIKENMTQNPVTVPVDFTIDETAAVLLKNKISGAPVMDHEGKMAGIIAQADIFRALASLTGLEKQGIQFALRLPDTPGTVEAVTDIIRQTGGHLASILAAYSQAPVGYRNVYIRAYGIDREKLPSVEEQIHQKAKVLYIIDHGQNRREIF